MMRVEVPVERLGRQEWHADAGRWTSMARSFPLAVHAALADVVVIVKDGPQRLARALRRMGRRVVFDCVDNFEFETHWAFQKGAPIDAYLVNNERHRSAVSALTGVPESRVYSVPHHHSNFGNHLRSREAIRTVGYVGKESNASFSVDLIEWFTNQDLEFAPCYRPVVTNEDAISETGRLDIFVVPNDPSEVPVGKNQRWKERALAFKPAQKIMLPFSMRIPTVFYPFQSFLSAIETAGYLPDDFLVAADDATIRERIGWILRHRGTVILAELLDRQMKVAEQFAIGRITERYADVLREVKGRTV